MQRDSIDLGSVKVSKLFRAYLVPTLLGMLSMSAVTAIDGIFVGHGIGSDGLATVNICATLYMLFTGVGLMAGAGSSIVASIHLSQGNVKAARINITQGLIAGTLLALIPSLLFITFPATTARLLGSSEHLTPMVVEYLIWFVPSFIFQVWCSVCLFVIRLDGSPGYAMLCNIVAAGLTTICGYLFIFVFDWGLMGAAFASSVALFVGGMMGLVYLFGFAKKLRLYRIKLSRTSLQLTMRNIGYQFKIGSSALLTEATMATLLFVGNRVFMHYLGDDGVGAFGLACYYTPFVFMIGNAIAQSAQPIISYNFGLGDMGRVSATERLALRSAILCGLVVMAVFMLFPDALVALFISTTTAAGQIAIEGLPYFSTAFVFFILNLTVIGYCQSLERVKEANTLALLRGFIFLIPSFIFLPQVLGDRGIWMALFLSEGLTTLVIVIMYLGRRKRAGRLHKT